MEIQEAATVGGLSKNGLILFRSIADCGLSQCYLISHAVLCGMSIAK